MKFLLVAMFEKDLATSREKKWINIVLSSSEADEDILYLTQRIAVVPSFTWDYYMSNCIVYIRW